MNRKFKDLLRNYHDLKLEIEKRIVVARINSELIQKVFKVCGKFEGEKITKKIVTEFNKNYPGHTVNLNPSYKMYNLKVWVNGLDWNDHLSALIGYHDNPIVNMKIIRESNQCYVLEEGRAEKMKKGLKHLEYIVDRWNSAVNCLHEIHVETEKYEFEFKFYL